MHSTSPTILNRKGLLAAFLSCSVLVGMANGCSEDPQTNSAPQDAIRIGAALPFSGSRASTGIHLERALMLAVEDVNRAGGVDGRMLHLKVRDSNSGSERGLAELEKLLTEDDVSYLVGPEEEKLALDIVRDVKRQDVFQVLPAYTSPSITDSGRNGAWLRLVPSILTMGCALATKAWQDGVLTTRTIAARDDYHLELAAVTGSAFSKLGGLSYPTVSVNGDESSYERAISQVNRYQADATLMLTYPGTAATIIKEMARSSGVRWYFSPMLRDDALLWNLPEGALKNATGISPSLSNNRECEYEASAGGAGGAGGAPASFPCEADTAARFARHYEQRWGTQPLQSAHFYYDAVIILALGLERAATEGVHDPKPQELLPFIVERSEDDDEAAWDSLDEALALARDGTRVHYVGAAGEYEFNKRGQNLRAIVDTWTINQDHQFATRESVVCRENPNG